MISVVDCGIGNLRSVISALDYLGEEAKAIDSPGGIKSSDRLILPGVGAFGYMMRSLREKKLEEPLKAFIDSGQPFFGICLGMQVLFEESEESPGISGLGIFKGRVVRFTKGKVPQVGWNFVVPKKGSIFEQGFVYFVNSYYVVPDKQEIVSAVTDYYGEFASAIQKRNVTAVQFHPEKSGEFGIRILKRWLKC